MKELSLLLLAALITTGVAPSQVSNLPTVPTKEQPTPHASFDYKGPMEVKDASAAAIPWWVRPEVPQALSTTPPPDRPPTSLRRVPTPEKVFTDLPGDGNIWARGVTYKARFGSDGAEYIPYLGSWAPRNFPLGLTFERATVGGREMARGALVVPSIEGTRVTYDRGPLREIYELRLREVEQLFLIPAVALGPDDLVIRTGVSSEMTFAGSSEEELYFEAPEGLGGVLVGPAVAIDAGDQVFVASTVFVDGGIEIRLPASAVAAATFPLTIDPTISTFPIDYSPTDDFVPDVAFDETSGKWECVYEQVYSSTDHDIVWTSVSQAGVGTFNGYVDFTASNWGHPRIANLNYYNGCLVVAHRDYLPPPVDFDIWGRTLDSSMGTFLSPQFSIDSTVGSNQVNPDVGGDAWPLFGVAVHYLVVWEHEYSVVPLDHDIRCRTVTHAAAPVLGTLNAVAAALNNEHDPAISNSTGPIGIWGVAFVRDFVAPDKDILVRPVSRFGILGAITTNLDPAFTEDDQPSIACNQPPGATAAEYLVVWRRDFLSDHDIVGRRLNSTLTVNTLLGAGTVNLTLLETPGTLGLDQINPSVDANGCDYAYSYSERVFLGNYNINCATVMGHAILTVPAGEGHVNLASSVTREDHPKTASRWSSSYQAPPGGASYFTVWDDLSSAGNRDIEGAFHGSGSFSVVPSSCGAPAPTLATSGAPSLGGWYGVTMATVPVLGLSTPFLLVGLPGILPICGGGVGPCTVGVNPILIVVVGGFGGVGFSAVVPCDPTLLGAVFAFQGFQLPGGPGGCPVAGYFPLLSDTVHITIQ